ncbi:MAG: BrnT family toxin, partial [Deltaproteobacteria bacterium]
RAKGRRRFYGIKLFVSDPNMMSKTGNANRFFDRPLLVLDDPKHSAFENRWAAFGNISSAMR